MLHLFFGQCLSDILLVGPVQWCMDNSMDILSMRLGHSPGETSDNGCGHSIKDIIKDNMSYKKVTTWTLNSRKWLQEQH